MTSIKATLSNGFSALMHHSPTPRIDAELLLSLILKKNRTYLYTHPETVLTALQLAHFQTLIHQRLSGHPIAYLTGSKEFWSLPLTVTPDTLIPRPETELLIELILKHLNTTDDAHILDLGTGSGAIALALASERPQWSIQAYDNSESALQIARQNALNLNLTNAYFGHSNWFESIPSQTFDVIVSNPPYIAENDHHLNEGDLRFEPRQALASGADGLDAIRQIIPAAMQYLKPQGLLILEHGFDQKNQVTALFQQCGYLAITCTPDWQGNDRITMGFKG